MGIEKPDFHKENIKSKQEHLTSEMLQDQIRLPRDQWSESFKKLVEEKIREKDQQENAEETEESTEVLRESAFNRYVNYLGLDETQLQDKKVLDLGSGEGEFVKYLIENNITPEAYGIDTNIEEEHIEDEFREHFIRGDFEKEFSVQDVDYVVSVGAVSKGVWAGEETMDIKRIIENSFNSLKEDGEIRISYIEEAAEATPFKGVEKSRKKWNELLKEISKEQDIEYEVKPRDIRVSGKDNDVILESVLVIRRKKD